MKKRFLEKVVVISEAGSLIGSKVAFQLAQEGASLALIDKDEKGLHNTKREILNYYPGSRVLLIVSELKEEVEILKIIDKIIKTYGQIDGFFNNIDKSIDEKIDTLEKLTKYSICFDHVLNVMNKQSFGSIVNYVNLDYVSEKNKFYLIEIFKDLSLKNSRSNININAINHYTTLYDCQNEHLIQLLNQKAEYLISFLLSNEAVDINSYILPINTQYI